MPISATRVARGPPDQTPVPISTHYAMSPYACINDETDGVSENLLE